MALDKLLQSHSNKFTLWFNLSVSPKWSVNEDG